MLDTVMPTSTIWLRFWSRINTSSSPLGLTLQREVTWLPPWSHRSPFEIVLCRLGDNARFGNPKACDAQQLPSWQIAGNPVSLFAQYRHTWWGDANFNAPASSPACNYAFRREDDTFKLGVNFYFGAGPAAPAYPVKAPA